MALYSFIVIVVVCVINIILYILAKQGYSLTNLAEVLTKVLGILMLVMFIWMGITLLWRVI